MLLAVYAPLERLWPMRRQPWLRPAWRTDLLFYAGQAFLFGPVSVFALSAVHEWVSLDALAPVRGSVGAWHPAFQLALAIVLGDVAVYWFHRASHHFGVLWRFHRVHHTSTSLDWLAAHRE